MSRAADAVRRAADVTAALGGLIVLSPLIGFVLGPLGVVYLLASEGQRVRYKPDPPEPGRRPQYQIEFVVMSTFRNSWKVNDARQPS